MALSDRFAVGRPGSMTVPQSVPIDGILFAVGGVLTASTLSFPRDHSSVLPSIAYLSLVCFCVAAFVMVAKILLLWGYTGSIGAILLDRVTSTINNWQKETLRSFVELSVWLSVMQWTLQTSGRIELAILCGTISGCAVVLCGELLTKPSRGVERCLRRHAGGESDKQSVSDGSGSFAMKLILGYNALSLISYMLSHATGTATACLTAALAGTALLTAAHTCRSLPLTIEADSMLQQRILCTFENWKEHPMRSATELVLTIGVTLGTYADSENLLLSIQTGVLAGAFSCLTGELCTRWTQLNPTEDPQARLFPTCVCVYSVMLTCHALFNGLFGFVLWQQLLLAVISATAYLLLARIFMSFPLARQLGCTLEHRITHTQANWEAFPLRSFSEVAVTNLVTLASYYYTASLPTAFSAGVASGCATVMLNTCWGVAQVAVAPKRGPTKAGQSEPKVTPSMTVEREGRIIHHFEASTGDVLKTGIDGKWYDITSFAAKHPGGDLIKDYVGLDASMVFRMFHSQKVRDRWLKALPVLGTYNQAPLAPADHALVALNDRFEHDGWYSRGASRVWMARQAGIIVALMAGAVIGACRGWFWLGAASLGICLQQLGFVSHDLMHNEVFQDRRRDQYWGWWIGNVGFGVSSKWWRDEHFAHHAFTNTVIDGVGSSDPQQFEEGLFAQHPSLLQFYKTKPWIVLVVLKLQHVTFLPVMVLLSAIGIRIASLTLQKGAWEHLGVGMHWVWMFALHYCLFDDWKNAALFWYTAFMCQGILGLQLCLSHYDKPFVEMEEGKKMSWLRKQAMQAKDVITPTWLDWFHGGLNIHLVHHVLPRMPRCRFREADRLLQALCADHEVPTEQEGFFAATCAVVCHMYKSSQFLSWTDLLLHGELPAV